MNVLKGKKKYWVISLFIVIMTCFLFSYFYNTRNEEITYFNENWELSINNSIISKNFNVATEKFNTLKKGDIIELRNTFPNVDYIDDTLEIFVTYTSLELFVENELIYQSGLQNIEEDKMLCDGLKWVNLPNEIANKDVYIRMIVGENNAISAIKEIKIANRATITNYFIKDNILPILFGGFLLVFGLFLLIVVMISVNRPYFDAKIFYLCAYCLCIGLWLLAEEYIFTLILGDDIIIKYIEYMALYLAPLTVFGFISNIKEERTDKLLFNKWLIRFGLISFSLLTIITTFLQAFNIVHLKQTLICYQCLIIFTCAGLLINLAINLKKKLYRNKTLLLGISFMVCSICLDVLLFNLRVFDNNFLNFYFENITTIGVMILLFALFEDYYKTIVQILIKSSREEALERLAYLDILTGLNNRTWYEQYIKNIQEEYTMISMDLNNLKAINDNLGHNQGDELIKRFATILQHIFSLQAHTVRFGGDEFLVILEYINREKVTETLKEMNRAIQLMNQAFNDEIAISVSYGIAYSNEKDRNNPNDIYKLADKRMYKMKKKMKEKPNSIENCI